MLASVIIPTYNGSRYIAATIDGVIAQTVSNWELIIVDDGSQNSTTDIVHSYVARDPRIRLHCQTCGNVAAARNTGFANSSPCSDFIAFLDHDDLLEPDALDVLISTFDEQPDAVAAHGLARFVDQHGDPCRVGEAEAWTRSRQGVVGERLIDWPLNQPTTFAVEAVANYIFTPGQVVVRRQALESVGPLDIGMAPADDYDLWLRLCLLGDITFVDRIVLNFRQHDSNQSRRAAMMTRMERAVRRKFFKSPDLSLEQRNLARTAWRLWYRQLATQRLIWAKECLSDYNVVPAARQTLQALESYVAAAYGSR